MGLRDEILDYATSVAKKYDHSEISSLHLLYGIRRKLDVGLKELDIALVEKAIASKSRQPANQLKILSDVEAMLMTLHSNEDAQKVAIKLSKDLLGIEISGQVSTSTQPTAVAEPALEEELMTLDKSLIKLNGLIGLKQVKVQVSKLMSVHQANSLRVKEGLPKIPVGLHCVFTGSPGTGKTTVARYMAEMYYSIGLLPSKKFLEVDRSALVAGYIGQTAIKVQEAVEKAKGGVLFIDEAYSLSSDSGAGYGDEAISTLVKAMEDNRDNLAIIVAGYKEPMTRFIETNQGLKSRFQNYVHFDDYRPSELLMIFESLCVNNKINLNDSTRNAVIKHIELAKPGGEQGNARYMRNLFEKMFLNMSHRAAQDGNIEVSEIIEFAPSDIPEVEIIKNKSIGFTSQI